MKVFVTGATGSLGSVVVPELIEAGHQVLGLARSDAAAASLVAAGAQVHRGSLDDLDSLRSAAAASDGVIHLAFVHNFVADQKGIFSDYEGAVRMDLNAVQAIGEALEGTGKPFVVTSGTIMLTFMIPQGRLGTEKDVADAGSVAPRLAAENAALAFAQRGVRSSIVRLAPSVHDKRRGGFTEILIGLAREKGVSGYVGDGSNRWPTVHRLDAARLFRLALEKAPAGSVLHGVGEESVPTRTIAEVIGQHLNIPVVSISPEDASEHFRWFGPFSSVDNPTSSALTRKLLGWQPVHPTLIQDLEDGHFF